MNGGVENIGDYAFRGLYEISSLTGMESVKHVGEYAFEEGASLGELDLSSIETVGEYAFYDAEITSLNIGKNFESAGVNAFRFYYNSVYTLNFEFSVEELASRTFGSSGANPMYYANKVTFNGEEIGDSLTVNVKEIGTYAYAGIPITSLTIGDEVEYISEGAFHAGNIKTITNVVMSDNVIVIDDYAFANNSKMTSITLSKNLKEIGVNAFLDCYALQEIILPDSLEIINEGAFSINTYNANSSLRKVHIGKNLVELGNIFKSNYNVDEITINEGNENFVIDNGVLYNKNKTELIYGFDSSNVVVKILEGVTTIKNSAFRNSKNIAVVILPSTLQTIEDNAFLDCAKLTEVVNLSNINVVKGEYKNGYVGKYASVISKSLSGASYGAGENGFVAIRINSNTILLGYQGTEKDITVPFTITHISKYAFYGLKLDSLTIPNNVSGFDNYSFAGLEVDKLSMPAGAMSYMNNESVKDLTINSGVITTKLNEKARNNIETLTILEGVTFNANSNSSNAFEYCKKLKTLNIYCESVATSTFANCTVLETITIGSQVKSFNSKAFYNSKEIKTVIYDGTIDEWAAIDFKLDTNTYNNEGNNPLYYGADLYIDDELVQGEIAINTSTVGAYAFRGYSRVTAVVLGDNVTEIKAYAFANMPHLTHVTLGTNVKTFGAQSFGSERIYDIYNKSTNDIVVHTNSSNANFGRLGYNAKNVYTSAYSKNIAYSGGFATMKYGDAVVLVDYYGREKDIVIPSNITEIGGYAFKSFKATYLEDYTEATLTIPANVTKIDRYSFQGANFKTVTFANTKGWYYLSFNLSNNYLHVYEITDEMNNEVLQDRTYYYDIVNLVNDNGYLIRNEGTGKVLVKYVGDAIPESLTEATTVTLTVPEGITEIGASALSYFSDDNRLSIKVILPNSLKKISIRAFLSSERITEIDLQQNNSGWYKSSSGYSDGSFVTTYTNEQRLNLFINQCNYYYYRT